MRRHQGFSTVVILIIIALIALGGYWVWKNKTIDCRNIPEIAKDWYYRIGKCVLRTHTNQ